MTRAPLAIYGALRSGTTLLRLMVNGHPSLSCPGETDFIFDHLIPRSNPPRYDREALDANRIYRAHEAAYARHPLPDPTPDSFIARISEEGSKTPILILHRHLSKALDVYPDLRVIHLVRDPRDVARSSIGMGWAGHVYYGVDHWVETESDWQACKHRISPDQSLNIAYETLIAEPEDNLRRLAAFAGQDYDPRMLDYDADSTYAKPDPSLTVQWKRKQSPRDIGLVEAKIGSLLEASGYAPSGHPPVHPTAIERAALWQANRRAVWAKRIERYGLRDPLIVAAATKLGLPSLARAARRRMDARQVKYLK
jgi:hypothetical protein